MRNCEIAHRMHVDQIASPLGEILDAIEAVLDVDVVILSGDLVALLV